MDARKKMKAYIMPQRWMQIFGICLLVAALVLCAVGLLPRGGEEAAVLFYPVNTDPGTAAYLDVVGVSSWMYKAEDAVFYSVEDAQGQLYTVRLTQAQYDAMSSQQEYWRRDTDNVAVPAPYRLEGRAAEIDEETCYFLAQCWDISMDDYWGYFGNLYLDAASSGGTGGMWVILGVLAAVFGALVLVSYYRVAGTGKKCLKRLEETGLLEQAAGEFDGGCLMTIGKDRGRLSERFLFGRGSGAVVPYRDMLWCYRMNQRYYFVPVNSFLVVNTRDLKGLNAVNYGKKDRNNEIEDALALIAQRNPDTLMGYSQQNTMAYRDMVGK